MHEESTSLLALRGATFTHSKNPVAYNSRQTSLTVRKVDITRDQANCR